MSFLALALAQSEKRPAPVWGRTRARVVIEPSDAIQLSPHPMGDVQLTIC
jgi:hypothetical protein